MLFFSICYGDLDHVSSACDIEPLGAVLGVDPVEPVSVVRQFKLDGQAVGPDPKGPDVDILNNPSQEFMPFLGGEIVHLVDPLAKLGYPVDPLLARF